MDTENLRNPRYIVTTTPVIPPCSQQATIVLANYHVLMRPLQVGDLEAFHELRSQIEVMKWTSTGKVDADIHATRTWMARFIDMEDDLQKPTAEVIPEKLEAASARMQTMNFAIVYCENTRVESGSTGTDERIIGVAGFHKLEPEPECGYMIRKEYWGRGIATAVLKALLDVYWKLERVSIRQAFDPEKHELNDNLSKGDTIIPEAVKAVIEATNIGSQRVLEKCGFQYVMTETVQENGVDVPLAHYSLQRP